MKKAFLLLGIIIAAFILSCNGNSTKGEKSSVDTIWNENVQDKFFGVSFGESKETLIETFKKEGFVANFATSTEEYVHFFPTKSQYYSFGGYNWEMLDITFSNDKFVGIKFMNSSKDKAEAMSQYEQLKKLLTNKYKETIVEKKDTTVYGLTAIFSNDTYAIAACYRYESISKNILIGVSLEYFSNKYYKGAEDEL
jgi:hypothetical protein